MSTRQVYRGRLLDIRVDEVELPDGSYSTREYTIHPGAVVVIPVLPDGKILLIRQFRYPIGRVEIELPAGKIDPGETPEETLQRELVEETGFRAGKITSLAEIHPCVGYSDERMWMFLAENLEEETPDTDEDEFIEVEPMELSECLQLVRSGEIKDVKTIIGIFWAEKLLSGKWLPPE
ncbi:MAG: NUDIX domain-containing protein [Fidelibacterota bacterium]